MPICPPYLFFSATPMIKLPLFSLMLEILTIELLQEKLMLWIMQNQHRLIPLNGLTLQKLFMQYFCWHCIIRHSSAVFVIFCILQNYLEVLLNHRWSCDTLRIPNSYQSLMVSIYMCIWVFKLCMCFIPGDWNLTAIALTLILCLWLQTSSSKTVCLSLIPQVNVILATDHSQL